MKRHDNYTLAYSVPGTWANALPGVVYLVLRGDPEDHYAFFLCPCGCGRQIMLPFAGPGPIWSYAIDADGAISISPSIDIGDRCRSHFYLRHGRIEWCG